MKKPIFIAFTGPASSGKSTLVKHLSEILNVNYKVYTVSEIVRDILKQWKISLDVLLEKPDLFFDFQVKSLTKQILLEERLLESDYDIILFDRSVHDYFIYAALGLSPQKYNEYKELFKDVTCNYDLLIYCEHLGFVNDGVRSKKYIELGEIGLFQTLVKPYTRYTLDVEPHWRRIQKVLKWLERCLPNDSRTRQSSTNYQ